MGHKPRIEVPGGFFHVTVRGNARQRVFFDDVDYSTALRTLAKTVAERDWRCHAYCLMPNHFHLVLETPEPNLAHGMLVLNGTVARRFNARYERTGHVFEGPYDAVLIEEDAHLRESLRYVALNPVRAGLAAAPGGWPWSSYRATAASGPVPTFLDVDLAHGLFGGPEGFARFVADADTSGNLVAGRVR